MNKFGLKFKSAVSLTENEMKNVKGGDNTVLTESGGKILDDGDAGGSDAGYSEKERACLGKSLCAACAWSTKYNQTIYGYCSQNAFTPNRYCSDLRCHY